MRIIAVGAMPPPLQGNSLVFQTMVGHFRTVAPTMVADIGAGARQRGITYHLVRIAKVLRALAILVREARGPRALFHNVDAGLGTWYSVAIVGVARTLGYDCLLHHHSCAYTNRWMLRVALLFRLAGRRTVHIVLSPGMGEVLNAKYGSHLNMFALWNAGLVLRSSAMPVKAEGPLTLGHLSRLEQAKGLFDVLSTFKAMADDGATRLILVGRVGDDEARSAIEQTIAEYPGRVECLGQIADEQKAAFFQDIDVFLFPTQFVNEAQPMVLIEALQAGRPIITYDRGLIAETLQDSASYVIDCHESFVAAATSQLRQWRDNRSDLALAGQHARTRFEHILGEANEQLRSLLQMVARPTAGTRRDFATGLLLDR